MNDFPIRNPIPMGWVRIGYLTTKNIMYNHIIFDNLHELRVNTKGFSYPVATLVKVKSNVKSYCSFVHRYLHSKIFTTYNQEYKNNNCSKSNFVLQSTNERELVAGLIDDSQTSKGEVTYGN